VKAEKILEGGVDECEKHFVSDRDLIKLHDTCVKILRDETLAKVLLPTQSGFFFGNTEYNECYFDQINHTLKVIETAMKLQSDGWNIYYQSSW
jgi:hypothetical protein